MEKKVKTQEKGEKAVVTRVLPNGRLVFVEFENNRKQRPVPIHRLQPQKEKYEVGDKVTVDVPPMRVPGNPLSEDRLKEIEERRAAMRQEMESRREEVLKMRQERRKGFEK